MKGEENGKIGGGSGGSGGGGAKERPQKEELLGAPGRRQPLIFSLLRLALPCISGPKTGPNLALIHGRVSVSNSRSKQ